jgi:hypothetical protein
MNIIALLAFAALCLTNDLLPKADPTAIDRSWPRPVVLTGHDKIRIGNETWTAGTDFEWVFNKWTGPIDDSGSQRTFYGTLEVYCSPPPKLPLYFSLTSLLTHRSQHVEYQAQKINPSFRLFTNKPSANTRRRNVTNEVSVKCLRARLVWMLSD